MGGNHSSMNIFQIGIQKDVTLLVPVGIHAQQIGKAVEVVDVDSDFIGNGNWIPCAAPLNETVSFPKNIIIPLIQE